MFEHAQINFLTFFPSNFKIAQLHSFKGKSWAQILNFSLPVFLFKSEQNA